MLKIICIGAIKEKEMTSLINEYLKRLQKYTKIEVIELPDYSYDLKNTIKRESDLILKNINSKDFVFKGSLKSTPATCFVASITSKESITR